MNIGITGPRKLSPSESLQIRLEIELILTDCCGLYVGDAAGVDAIAVRRVSQKPFPLMLFEQKTDLPHRARCAERTTRMMKALAAAGGVLHGWPNKPAPPALRPSRSWPQGAQGSGTWGAISLAVGLGVPVQLHPLVEDLQWPDWLKSEQLVLFSLCSYLSVF